MKYDFISIIDRRGKDALAVDGLGGGGSAPDAPKEGFDAIPMWVADMNFPVLPAIQEAITERVKHPAFGYFQPADAYFDAIIDWQRKRNGVTGLTRESIGYENGVLGGLVSVLEAFSAPGDAVLLHSPTYIGFTGSISNSGRRIVHSPLKLDESGVWRMDYADMDAKIRENKIHVAVFCNPFNPCGRVWEREELEQAMEVYRANDCVVISDEIWSDIILKGNRHIPVQSVSEDARNRTIALYAPSKTFNLAGLQVSNIFIANPSYRRQFVKAISQTGYEEINVMGLVSCQAAYEEGEPWLLALKEYLEGNRTFVREYLAKYLPMIHLIEPEGTYLLWLDFRELGLTEEALESLIVEKARLWLDRGAMFGKEGEGFERINIACPKTTLEQALSQLKKAVTEQEV